MKSFCIKTNNRYIIDYLLNRLENINMDDVYISNKQFKIYDNIIVHYKGNDISGFLNELCDVLSDIVLDYYENMKLKEIINVNYFYFSDIEKSNILDSCIDYYLDETNIECNMRKEHIYISLLCYINENKSFILDGFVNFRLKEYISTLDYTVDNAVNNFLIEREYNEFISLLKIYIDSKPSKPGIVHLIYTNGESILIDDNKNIISVSENILNAKYLSDISFSSNDYALNTLLTILPQKVIIHVIDKEDEFTNTLKLIFDNRLSICNHCSICMSYRLLEQNVKR